MLFDTWVDFGNPFIEGLRKDIGCFVPFGILQGQVLIAQSGQVQNRGDFHPGIFIVLHCS